MLGGAEAILAKAVLGALAGEASKRGLQELERRLRGDPEERALRVALRDALQGLESEDRHLASESLFDQHFLSHGGAPILARCLTAHPPAPAELARAWQRQFGDGGRSERMETVAARFLERFGQELPRRAELRPLLQLASSTRTAVAAEATADLVRELRPRPSEEVYDFSEILAGAQHFVGRDYAFASIEAFANTNSRGYLRIVGDAGLGKSALAAAIAVRLGAAAFFFGPGRGGRSPQNCLEHLCAELIARHELNHSYLPGRAGQDSNFLGQLLRESAEKSDGQVWVVVDALDEADEQALTVFPETLPTRAFFVVTHRPGDFPIVRTPGIPLVSVELRPDDEMQQHDVRAYAQSRLGADPALVGRLTIEGGRADASQAAEALSQRSAGSFVYLTFVLADLAAGRTMRLQDLPDGLADYYATFWAAFAAKRDPDRTSWRSLYKPVLEFLAVAREPVDVHWLAGLTGADPEEIEDAPLRDWERFLSRPSPGHWSMVHESVADFLRTKMDLRRAHERVAAHYQAAERWDAQDGYAFRHLAAHLRAAEDSEGLFALADNPEWEAAQLSDDPSGARFLEDITHVWRAADDSARASVQNEKPPSTLDRQLWCLLATATYNGRSEAIPGGLLAALVRDGRWSFDQALAAVAQNPDVSLRASALAALVPHLPPDRLPRAEALVRDLPFVLAIGAHVALAARSSSEVREAVFETVRRSAHDRVSSWPIHIYTEAIASLPAGMRDELVEEAVAFARSLPEHGRANERRGPALVALSEVVDEALAERLAADALDGLDPEADDDLRDIARVSRRAGRVGGVDVRLAAFRHSLESSAADATTVMDIVESLKGSALAEVTRVALATPLDERRAAALQAALPQAEERVANEALRLAEPASAPAADRVRSGAAERLIRLGRMDEAAEIAGRIIGDAIRFWTLISLLRAVPKGERRRNFTTATRIAAGVEDAEARAEAFHALAGVAPADNDRTMVLAEAIHAAARSTYLTQRAWLLARIAPDLPSTLLTSAVSAALAPHDEDLTSQVDAFIALAKATGEAARTTMLRAATRAATQLPPRKRREALARLVPLMATSGLAEEVRHEVLGAPIDDRPELREPEAVDDWRVELLSQLAPYLPPALRQQTLDQCEAAARKVDHPWLLMRVAEHAGAYRPGLPTELESRVRQLTDSDNLEWPLRRLVPLLPGHRRIDVFREVLALDRKAERISFGPDATWASLPTHPPGQLGRLFEPLHGAPAHWRVAVLAQAAESIPDALIAEFLEHVRRTEAENPPVLIGVAAELASRGAVEAGLAAIEGLTFDDADVTAVMKLIPHLDESTRERELTAALQLARESEPEWTRGHVLKAVVPQLSLHLLPDAVAVAQTVRYPGELLAAVAVRRAELGDMDRALADLDELDYTDRVDGLLALAKLFPDLLRDPTRRAEILQYATRTWTSTNAKRRTLDPLADAVTSLGAAVSYSTLEAVLHALAGSSRADATGSLTAVTPLLPVVAGEAGIHAAAKAIQAVADRWT